MRQIWRWIQHEPGYKLLSLVIATLLWFYVVSESNPVEEVTRQVSLREEGVPEHHVVLGEPTFVQLRLRGPKNVLDRLHEPNLVAYIDVSDREVGVHEVPVQTQVPSGVEVLEVKPPSCIITLDELVKKELSVDYRLRGVLPDGYEYVPPTISPKRVTVEGPSGQVAKVRRAEVDIDIGGKMEDFVQKLIVWLRDENGQEVAGVTANPANVQIHMRIRKITATKTVRLVPIIENRPANGYTIGQITIDPPTVTLQGEMLVLDTIEYVPTVPLDIANAQANVRRRLPLQLPRGVRAVGLRAATVQVEILKTVEPETSRRR
ncbi:MAG TPA: hypothetical protein EYP85_12140 [Armatimonadetes bacterium]|nr:hypothetical protein [Armatimonadota bacterium]